MIITQGTTPTHGFQLPFDTEIIKTARFVYSQNGEVVFVKTGEDVEVSTDGVSTTLTQEDTYSLVPDVQTKLVLRVLTVDNEALVSDPVWFLCYGCDCKEVMR